MLLKIHATDTHARHTIINLARKPIETPVFMPVATAGAIRALPFERLEEIGYQIILSNTYHLYLRPGIEVIETLSGLHNFIGWKHNILTDSGGFQVFSLKKLMRINDEGVAFRSHIDGSAHAFTPESVIHSQIKLGSDIIMPLDHPTSPEVGYLEAKNAVSRTTAWLKRSIAQLKLIQEEQQEQRRAATDASNATDSINANDSAAQDKNSGGDCGGAGDCSGGGSGDCGGYGAGDCGGDCGGGGDCDGYGAGDCDGYGAGALYTPQLFGIVQGNFYPPLRAQSAEQIIALNPAGYAIGGMSVGEEQNKFFDILAQTATLLPADKPRYLMGVGTPEYLLYAIECGIDMFDCVYPTRMARHGIALTSSGKLDMHKSRFRSDQRPLDADCQCETCRAYTRAYIHHLSTRKEIMSSVLLSEHNLFFLHWLCREARAAIDAGRYQSFMQEFLHRYENDNE